MRRKERKGENKRLRFFTVLTCLMMITNKKGDRRREVTKIDNRKKKTKEREKRESGRAYNKTEKYF